jgi:serine/threonine-protein kinase
VYKASDPLIGRIVAIKIILTAGLDSGQLADYNRRFFREAQLAGRVSHPGIVTIYDIEEDAQGQPYLVMEFVEGTTLQHILRPAHNGHLPYRLPLDRALDLALQTAEALDYAHRSGVVHSDVKPANILVTPEGRVRVADFGIARFANSEASHVVLGTPAYMAPEQLRGGRVDARSDIFSAGAMLYWMVTGQKAFPGEDLASVSFKIAYTDPRKPSEIDPALPADLDTVISRCLAKNRADRYPTAKSLALDLQLVAAGEPINPMPVPGAGEPEETVTATVPLTAGPFVTAAPVRRAAVKERPLSRGLVTAAILVLTLAVIAIPTRQSERIVLIPAPVRPSEIPAPAVPEEESAVPPPEAESPAAPPVVVRPPVRTPETLKPLLASPASIGQPLVIEAVEPPEAHSVLATAAAKPVAADSALFFECRHNFRNATLSISSDGQELEMTMLEKKGIWFASSGGRVENQTPLVLPAGTRRLRVRVRSNDENKPFDQEASIEGTFPESGALRLKIEFPKNQLRLRWSEE